MPIFYNITPFDVRHRTGSFEEAFQLHDCSFSEEIVGKWKQTLKEIGSLKGWDFTTGRQHEGEVTKEVVNRVLRQLKKSYLVVTDFLVGVEDRVENIKSIISAGSREEKIIGMHGPGGIGKTTLAKVVYNQLSNDYEGCSFLANVRDTSNLKDTGIMRLQNQLLSDILKTGMSTVNSVDEGAVTIKERLCKKKVLICFDDVSKRNQLKSFVGNSNWFGPGSKIIITTRNKELLNEVGAYSSYEVTEMDSNRSLQLFSKHAFRRDCPPVDYITYSERVVKLTGGLPLALEVIGSVLHGKPKDSWGAKLEKLEKVSHEEVKESLMISYQELDDCQKQIFLDVACFFVGFDKRMVLYFWDPDFYPREGMEVLEHMSLLKIKKDNTIWMHDQIIDFGRNIIYERGNVKQDNRRRWRENDEAFSILKKGKKEEGVEAMFVVWEHMHECGYSGKLFACVPSLTFLRVCSLFDSPTPKLLSVWRNWTNPTVLPQLRWLSLNNLDPLWFRIKLHACKLVILDLSCTYVSLEWDGWSQIKAATSLKVLNLTACRNLKRTPDLSVHVKLELLILYDCTALVQIHKSVGRLKCLLFLNLRNCLRLHELPEEVNQLESLIELELTGSGVRSLPGSVGNMKSLKVLRLYNTGITELPADIERAENLEEIYADCLRKIPSEIGRSSSLVTLKISRLSSVPKLPESLMYLHLEFLINQPKNEVPDLSNLVNLRDLDLKLYQHRKAPLLFWWIGRLSKLETLTLVAHDIHRLCAEDELGSLPLLKTLHLEDCKKLQSLPRLPSSLLHITIRNCRSMGGLIDVSNLNWLLKFNVSFCDAITEICGLSSSLAELHLSVCESLKSIGDISNLKMLSTLAVSSCAFTKIQGLGCLENLQILRLRFLPVLERLTADLGRLSQLKELDLCHLPSLQGIFPRLPSNLESLSVEFADTSLLREIPGHEHLVNRQLPPLPSNLKKLLLIGCEQLLGLLRLPPSLVQLEIYGCTITILDVSDLTELKDLEVRGCPIEEIRGLHCLVNLSSVRFNDHSYEKPKPAYLQRELFLHYGVISSDVAVNE